MRPKIFDRRSYCFPDDNVPVAKPHISVNLDPDYAAAWMVAGDIDGDGQVELVSARNNNKNDAHEVTSVIAHKLDGTVLWRWGNPAAGSQYLGYDVACQIHDWDGDGALEVIIATRDRVIELDGATGKERSSFPLPPDASDCLSFANLSGGQYASELIVKTRYSQVWAFDRRGRQLWTHELPGGCKTAHQVFAVDIDGDGKDELIAGFAMLNSDGSLRWKITGEGMDKLPDTMGCHLDCVRVVTRGRTPEEWRLVASFCANERLAMLDGNGKIVWAIDNNHFESIDVCKVCPELPGKQIVVDIGTGRRLHAVVWIIDEYGELLGKLFTHESRFHFPINWDGSDRDMIVVAGEFGMFDGNGHKVLRFEMPGVGEDDDLMCARGMMTPGGRPDIVFWTTDGRRVFIFKNEHGRMSAPGLPMLTEKNYTLY